MPKITKATKENSGYHSDSEVSYRRSLDENSSGELEVLGRIRQFNKRGAKAAHVEFARTTQQKTDELLTQKTNILQLNYDLINHIQTQKSTLDQFPSLLNNVVSHYDAQTKKVQVSYQQKVDHIRACSLINTQHYETQLELLKQENAALEKQLLEANQEIASLQSQISSEKLAKTTAYDSSTFFNQQEDDL